MPYVVVETSAQLDGLRPGDPVACQGGDYASHAEQCYVTRNLIARCPANVDLREADPSLRDARSAKVAAALLTLERYIGWPALQRGLSLASERFRGRTMSTDDFARTIGDAI